MVWLQAEGEAQNVETQQNMAYFDQIGMRDWQSHCVRSSHSGRWRGSEMSKNLALAPYKNDVN
jgi:hypothetical protein